MNRSLHLIFLLGFLSISHYLSAQIGICNQVIASAGKATVQGGRTYAYTIGEPFIFPIVLGVIAWIALGLRRSEVFDLALGKSPVERTS